LVDAYDTFASDRYVTKSAQNYQHIIILITNMSYISFNQIIVNV